MNGAITARKGQSAERARIYWRELRRIQREHGVLTAPLVVGSAAAKASPLHDYFEWDDTQAARNYRLDQARHLIAEVKVTIANGPGTEPIRVGVFHRVTDVTDEGMTTHYVTLDQVSRKKEYREEVLSQALATHKAWEDRYRHLREVIPIVEAAKRVRGDTRVAR